MIILISATAIPHTSPSFTPMSTPGPILCKPGLHDADKLQRREGPPQRAARRACVSLRSLISSPYCPSMPILKVISWISCSDFPRNNSRASSREKAAVHLGHLALSSRAAISRSPFLARPMVSRAMELQTSKEILAEIFPANSAPLS